MSDYLTPLPLASETLTKLRTLIGRAERNRHVVNVSAPVMAQILDRLRYLEQMHGEATSQPALALTMRAETPPQDQRAFWGDPAR